MKKILFLFLVVMAAGSANAQIQNTSWKGIYNIPDPLRWYCSLNRDTLLLNYSQDGGNAELMNYQMKGDTLIMTKINGISPCDGVKGSYKLSVKDDKLFMTLIEDSCDARASAMPQQPLVKVQ